MAAGCRHRCHIHLQWGCGHGAAANENPTDRVSNCYAPLPLTRPAPTLYARVCVSLGTWREKTSSLIGDLQREKRIASPRSQPSLVRLKVDVIVTAGPEATRAAKEDNFYDSHCDDAGTTTRLVAGLRRQPGASRQEHYGIGGTVTGNKRKTTGAFEGDRSQALPGGRLRDFDPTGQRAKLKETELAAGALKVSFNT